MILAITGTLDRNSGDIYALEKTHFLENIRPLCANPAPARGRGRMRCLGNIRTAKFLYDCVQVIRHNRIRGMPQRRGQSPRERHSLNKMISHENRPSGIIDGG